MLAPSSCRRAALVSIVIAALGLLFGAPARALDAAAAQATVETLHDGLSHIMANGPELGLPGRAEYIGAVVDRTYEMRGFVARAIGTGTFGGFSEAGQAEVVEAYRQLVVANYACSFREPSPISFTTEEVSAGPGGTLVVRTALTRRTGDQIALSYVIEGTQTGEGRIADILYDGVSETARRRSEFGSLAAQGPEALAQAIRSKAAQIEAECEPQAPAEPAPEPGPAPDTHFGSH